MGYREEIFNCFKVTSIENDYSFFHIDIDDTEEFYKKIFDYFFSEEKLLRYSENNFNLKFLPSKTSYTKLYKNLLYFIDRKNLEEISDLTVFNETICSILVDEYLVENKEGKNFIKIDKYGKVGEYIFSCILSEYFKLDCIIPKIKLSTSFNMSVFGIDTLFYSIEQNIIYFGESKVSKSLKNGIELVNESLKNYSTQIENEFFLTLSNRVINCNEKFLEKFEKYIDTCISFSEFISCAKITKIAVPIFIAHGKDIDNETIFNELKKLPRKSLCNLDTKYYAISMPILNKDKMMAVFTREIREKEEFYKNAR